MATHSSILSWRILRTEEAGGLWSIGSQSRDTTEATTRTHRFIISSRGAFHSGLGTNANLLICSLPLIPSPPKLLYS